LILCFTYCFADYHAELAAFSSNCRFIFLFADNLRVKQLRKLEIENSTVTGVTQLLDRMYVVCRKSNRVLVYDSATFARLEDIVVEPKYGQTLWPRDMAACSVNNCLYITDINNYAIWRVKENKEEEHLVWLMLHANIYLLHLSVTSQGHVLLLGTNPPTLYAHYCDGSVERTLELPSDMREPHHALENATGNYIISHGDQASDLHWICEVTKNGHVIRSFGGQCGGGQGQVNCPVHIALDELGRVYVADYNNDRVVVLDPSLNLSKVVLSRGDTDVDDARHPHRLFYAQDTQRLIVGRSGCVDILQLCPYT